MCVDGWVCVCRWVGGYVSQMLGLCVLGEGLDGCMCMCTYENM